MSDSEWRMGNSVSLLEFFRRYWDKRKDQKNIRRWARTGDDGLEANPNCKLAAFFLQNAFYMQVKTIHINIWKDENPPSILLETPKGMVADDTVKVYRIEEIASILRLLPYGWVLRKGVFGYQEAIVELPHFKRKLVIQYFPSGEGDVEKELADIEKSLDADDENALKNLTAMPSKKHRGQILRIEIR